MTTNTIAAIIAMLALSTGGVVADAPPPKDWEQHHIGRLMGGNHSIIYSSEEKCNSTRTDCAEARSTDGGKTWEYFIPVGPNSEHKVICLTREEALRINKHHLAAGRVIAVPDGNGGVDFLNQGEKDGWLPRRVVTIQKD